MLVGQRIRKLRKEKNLSQQDLGYELGVTKVSVCGYENGTRTPSLDVLVNISEVLGVSLDYLVGREEVVINEENENIVKMSSTDIEIIECMKKYPDLYNKVIKDPNRYVSLLNKKLK